MKPVSFFAAVVLTIPLMFWGCYPDNTGSPDGSMLFGTTVFSSDGKYYAREIESPNTGQIGVFDRHTHAEVWTWNTLPYIHWENSLKGLAWSPDSTRLAVMYHGGAAAGSGVYVFELFREDLAAYGDVLGYYHSIRYAANGNGVLLGDGPVPGPVLVPLTETEVPEDVAREGEDKHNALSAHTGKTVNASLPAPEKNEEYHPADLDDNFRIVISEAIAYLAGWQQGNNPMGHAIRGVYLWQHGETYAYDPGAAPPLCWVPQPPAEGEGEEEGESEGEGEGESEGEDSPYWYDTIIDNLGYVQYRFWHLDHHFLSVIDVNGKLSFRPHPGLDINGWGSSWYPEAYLFQEKQGDALSGKGTVDAIIITPEGITLTISGDIAYGHKTSRGAWSQTMAFSYMPLEKRVEGTGVTAIALDAPLAEINADLNLCLIASNYLVDVPLRSGGRGNTGDMTKAVVQGEFPAFDWVPPDLPAHFPQDFTDVLSIEVIGAYNEVDTFELGNTHYIAPAVKPSLAVTLTSQTAEVDMIFGGTYTLSSSQDFSADNVGITPLVTKFSPLSAFSFDVHFESEALPEDALIPLPGAILCTLADAVTGDPVTGAVLLLDGSVPPTTIQEATYGFPYVFEGTHSLHVDAAGYTPRIESLEVYAAETTETTVYLNPTISEGEGDIEGEPPAEGEDEGEGEPPAEGETEVGLHVTGYPTYGEPGRITGYVTGVAPTAYAIATYIQVEQNWWTKPYFIQPLTAINSDGTFSILFITGGNDQYATGFALYLVPTGTEVPRCGPCAQPPDIPEAAASLRIDRTPPPRILDFSESQWKVRNSQYRMGPNQNYWTDSEEFSWVDEDGHLHLRVDQSDGQWRCVEVEHIGSLGHGLYAFSTRSRLDLLDKHLVFAGFTFEDASPLDGDREFDHEFSRWGLDTGPMAQFVYQPWDWPGRRVQYDFSLTEEAMEVTCYISWQPGHLEFRAYRGAFVGDTPAAEQLIHSAVFTGEDIPTPGNETFRFNFWLNDDMTDHAPSNGLPAEVVVTDFSWTPDPAPWE